MKHIALALALLTAPLAGCANLPSIPASASKIDEQALGAVYAAGTLANYAIIATAPTMSRDQALKVRAFKAKADAAVMAAEQAKAIGDAFAYAKAVADATSALNSVSAALPASKEK